MSFYDIHVGDIDWDLSTFPSQLSFGWNNITLDVPESMIKTYKITHQDGAILITFGAYWGLILRIGIVGAGSLVLSSQLPHINTCVLLYGRGLHTASTSIRLKISGARKKRFLRNDGRFSLKNKTFRICSFVVRYCPSFGKPRAERHVEIAKHLLRQDGIICTLANGRT